MVTTGAVKPLEAPATPADVELYALRPTALRVEWTPPETNGGQAIVRYLVQ